MSKPLNQHSAIGVLAEVPGLGIMLAYGATPSDTVAGYAKGCLYIDTSAGALYVNVNTKASATWEIYSSS